MGLNFYYYDGLQQKMSAGIINEHECILFDFIFFYFLAGSIVSCIGLCLSTLSPDVPTLILTMGVIAGVGYGMINLPAKVCKL